MGRRWVRCVLVMAAGAATAVALAGCGSDEAGATSDPTHVKIGMLDNVFTRDVTRVPVGGTVRFTNDGDTIHNAVDADQAWSTEEVTGETARTATASGRA